MHNFKVWIELKAQQVPNTARRYYNAIRSVFVAPSPRTSLKPRRNASLRTAVKPTGRANVSGLQID